MGLPKPYYEHAGITIYHADCREVLPHLENVDLVLTDPPYGVGFQYETHDDSEVNVSGIVVPAIASCVDRFGRVVVTPGTRCVWLYPRPQEMGAIYFPAGAGFSRWGFTCYQPILYYGKDPKPVTRKEPNSFSFTFAAEKNGHPCPKPIGIMKWLVNRASLECETILDPFMGSGTTLVAAKLLNRNAIGIELEEKYCEIAAKRLAQDNLFYDGSE